MIIFNTSYFKNNFKISIIFFNSLLFLFFISLIYGYYRSHRVIAKLGNKKMLFKHLKRNLKKENPFFLNYPIANIRKYIKQPQNLKHILKIVLNHEAIWLEIKNQHYSAALQKKSQSLLYIFILSLYTREFFNFTISSKLLEKKIQDQSENLLFDHQFWHKNFNEIKIALNLLHSHSKNYQKKSLEILNRNLFTIHELKLSFSLIDCYNFFKFYLKLKKDQSENLLFDRFKDFIERDMITNFYYFYLGLKNSLNTRKTFKIILNLKKKSYLMASFIYEKKQNIRKLLNRKFKENSKFKNIFQNEYANYIHFFKKFNFITLNPSFIQFLKQDILNSYVHLEYKKWLEKLWQKYSISIVI